MSLSDLTRNSFQSGFSPTKWLRLSKLFISQQLSHAPRHDIEADLSNSVLVLFRSYPGDSVLQSYLKSAIQDGTLALSSFVSMFLAAARSRELHNTATLDVLCKLILDCHYMSGMPPIGSVIPFAESPVVILNTVQDCMALLRTSYTLPTSHFHQLGNSASELLILLLSSVTDVSNISTAQAMQYLDETSDMLQMLRLSPDVRHVLENFALSLSLLLGDDAKMAREAQMIHTFQLALSKGDIVDPNSDTDIVTCSLLLHNFVLHRADEFGAGDTDHAVVLLVSLIRWAAWTPTTFYTQLLHAAFACIAQQPASIGTKISPLLWRAFVVGRLPRLLSRFEKAVDLDGTSDADWRQAMQFAVTALLQRTDLLQKADMACKSAENSASSANNIVLSELMHQLLATDLVDANVVTQATLTPQSKLHVEAQEQSMDLEAYLDSKLTTDVSMETVAPLIDRLWRDPCSHSAFAELVRKRYTTSASSLDLETLGQLCKILYSHENALEIVSLHFRLSELVAHALVIMEDYDCETVGDPQSAVAHLGDVVLLLQVMLGRYHLGGQTFIVGERKLTATRLQCAAMVARRDDFKGEDIVAFTTWHKALFDSEGIEDSILRSTRPRSLLRVAATVLSHAIQLCNERKMEKSVLENGVQYFLSPVLVWTVASVVKALLVDMKQRSFFTPLHQEVVQQLLKPPSPPSIIRLLAPGILRLLPHVKIPPILPNAKNPWQFDPGPMRQLGMNALGVPTETATPTKPPIGLSGDSTAIAIRSALANARAGEPAFLDVNYCLLVTHPTKFLTLFWTELNVASTLGDLEAPRRLATYVLAAPRSAQSPPLLQIFLHSVLPNVIATSDKLVASEQAVVTELLVSIVSSALTAALYIEWAMLSVCKEQRLVLGQPALAMARRLGGDLRRKTISPTSSIVYQRLSTMSSFAGNFPTFIAEL